MDDTWLNLTRNLARRVAAGDELDDLLGPLLRSLHQDAGLFRPTLTRFDRDLGQLVIEGAHGLTPAETRRIHYALGEGLTGEVVRSGEPAAVLEVRDTPDFLDRLGAREDGMQGSFVCVPIRAGAAPLGALSALRHGADEATLARDLALLETLAALLVPCVERKHFDTERSRVPEREAASPPGLIGRSKAMRDVYELIDQVAATNTTVFLRGESGTGKERVASAIHRGSTRARGPFIKVNCAALPATVIESELFGHERGAFTGAVERRIGRFELASGGTLFLDEVGDLSAETQAKLLRVLQEREIERVGSATPIPVDVRVIAATSADVEQMIEQGRFRADLYYRLNVFPIRLPPLRERHADVLLLADHFVEAFARAHDKPVRRLATATIDLLMSYHWPGNVRELENCLERAVLLCRGDVLMAHHLPPTLQGPTDSPRPDDAPLAEALDAYEKDLILDALKATKGNKAAAARRLGTTERLIGLRVDKHGIDPKRFKGR